MNSFLRHQLRWASAVGGFASSGWIRHRHDSPPKKQTHMTGFGFHSAWRPSLCEEPAEAEAVEVVDLAARAILRKQISGGVDFKTILQGTQCCQGVPKKVVSKMVDGFGEPMFLSKGEAIIYQNECSEALYVVGDGGFDIFINEEPVAAVAKGSILGEAGLLGVVASTATCRASANNTYVLKVTHEDFKQSIADVQHAQKHFRSQSLRNKTENIKLEGLKEVVAFEDLAPEFLREVAKVMKPVAFADGEEVVKCGTVDDKGLITVFKGVLIATDKDKCEITKLEKGMYFGEAAAILGSEEPRKCTVKAQGKVEAYQLTRASFLKVAAGYPDIMEELEDLIGANLDELGRILA